MKKKILIILAIVMMQSSSSNSWLARPGTIALSALAGKSLLYPGISTVTTPGGTSVNLNLALGASIFISEILSEVAGNYIFPNVSKDQKLLNPLTIGFELGIVYLSTSMLLSLANPQVVSDLGMSKMILLVAGSVVGGSFLYDKFVSYYLHV